VFVASICLQRLDPGSGFSMNSLVPEPTTGVLLRVGIEVDSYLGAVSAVAVRELVLATLIVASRRRWVLVDAEKDLTSLARVLASQLGTLRHLVTPDDVEKRGLADRVHWVASVRGGSPRTPSHVDRLEPLHEVYAFATTGGTSARHSSTCSLIDGLHRLKHEISYAPLLADLLRNLGGLGWRGGFVRAPHGGPLLLGGSASLDMQATLRIDPTTARALSDAVAAAREDDKHGREDLQGVVSELLSDQPPKHIVLFGTAMRPGSRPGDVDLAAITAEGPRRHMVGSGIDLLLVSQREFLEAYHVGDLFAHMVASGTLLWGEELPKREPDRNVASRTRSVQIAYAVRLGWDLVRTATSAPVATWAARVRWVVRTIQLAIATEHGAHPQDVVEAAPWWGGTRALALCSGMTDMCQVERAAKELESLLVELGAVPPDA